MPRWTLEQLREFKQREANAQSKLRASRAEPVVCHEPVRPYEGEKKVPAKIAIRITSRRKRLLDPRGEVDKYLVDGLRYAGLIPNDRAKDITIQVEQVQVHGDDPTGTDIEIEYP